MTSVGAAPTPSDAALADAFTAACAASAWAAGKPVEFPGGDGLMIGGKYHRLGNAWAMVERNASKDRCAAAGGDARAWRAQWDPA